MAQGSIRSSASASAASVWRLTVAWSPFSHDASARAAATWVIRSSSKVGSTIACACSSGAVASASPRLARSSPERCQRPGAGELRAPRVAQNRAGRISRLIPVAEIELQAGAIAEQIKPKGIQASFGAVLEPGFEMDLRDVEAAVSDGEHDQPVEGECGVLFVAVALRELKRGLEL